MSWANIDRVNALMLNEKDTKSFVWLNFIKTKAKNIFVIIKSKWRPVLEVPWAEKSSLVINLA